MDTRSALNLKIKEKKVKKEFKRLWFAVIVSLGLLFVFLSGLYEILPPIIQLVLSKTLLVTVGVVVAHILRKFLFEKVDWGNDNNWQHTTMVIAFYIIIIYCFAMGG